MKKNPKGQSILHENILGLFHSPNCDTELKYSYINPKDSQQFLEALYFTSVPLGKAAFQKQY